MAGAVPESCADIASVRGVRFFDAITMAELEKPTDIRDVVPCSAGQKGRAGPFARVVYLMGFRTTSTADVAHLGGMCSVFTKSRCN